MFAHNIASKFLYFLYVFIFLHVQGAEYVEFDVHLSRDLVPVVYHDFVVNLAAHSVKNYN